MRTGSSYKTLMLAEGSGDGKEVVCSGIPEESNSERLQTVPCTKL